jgi:VanZ family protein
VKKITLPYALLSLLVLTLFVGTLMPGSVKSEIEGHMWSALPWSAMAHFVLFAAIAALPVYGRRWGGFAGALLLALALAASTELLQLWVPGRHPMVRDGLIDLAGALAGCALQVRMRSLRLLKP